MTPADSSMMSCIVYIAEQVLTEPLRKLFVILAGIVSTSTGSLLCLRLGMAVMFMWQ